MENVYSINGSRKTPEKINTVSLTGEVIYESVHRAINKNTLRKFIHRSIERRLSEVQGGLTWASYLVIFSPGQDYQEVRCQVDVETDRDRAGFSIGYGHRPNHAFNDAVERMQWYEKNVPLQISV
jgi:hypothetical protein